jgi:diaminohydroxyphosphoribosylaminopyrimidine deaminase/5-amino-6-(5-phosphoribosylamino)uracil reductase
MTLDGRIASRTGDSRWISSNASRRWAHEHLRGRADAILVGAGTVRADDPALTNRSGRAGQPLRVVACGRRRLPPRAKVVRDGRATLLVAPDDFRGPSGAEVVRAGRKSRVDPERMLRVLYDRGVRRLLVEGGRDLFGALFDKGLVDQVAVFVAPRIVGGVGAVPPVAGRGIARVAEALDLADLEQTVRGGDLVIEAYVRDRATRR